MSDFLTYLKMLLCYRKALYLIKLPVLFKIFPVVKIKFETSRNQASTLKNEYLKNEGFQLRKRRKKSILRKVKNSNKMQKIDKLEIVKISTSKDKLSSTVVSIKKQ